MPLSSPPLSPARSRRVTAATVPLRELSEVAADPQLEVDTPPVAHWLPVTVGASLVAAVAGWVIVAGLTVLGWLTATGASLGDAVRTGTRLWLLANGAGGDVAGLRLTLIPLGVTVLFAACLSGAAGFAARQSRAAVRLRGVRLDGPDQGELDQGEAARLGWRTVGVMSGVYVAGVTVTTILLGTPFEAIRGGLVSLLLAVAATGWGAFRALGYRPTDAWPPALQAVPRAAGAAAAVIAVGGCAALTAALLTHGTRVAALTDALTGGGVAAAAVLVLQLAYWPNLIAWAASYTLGAGFTLGDHSVISPSFTDLGLLPGLPVLGAVPPEGTPPGLTYALLGFGVLAGVAAGAVVVRAHTGAARVRADQTALVGGLAGVLAAVVVTGVAAVSGGDLGTARLAGIGPRLTELGVMAVALLGIAGALAGLVCAFLPAGRAAADQDLDESAEPDDDELDDDELDDADADAESGQARAVAADAESEGPDPELTVDLRRRTS